MRKDQRLIDEYMKKKWKNYLVKNVNTIGTLRRLSIVNNIGQKVVSCAFMFIAHFCSEDIAEIHSSIIGSSSH